MPDKTIRSAESPAFLGFGLALGSAGSLALILATVRLGEADWARLALLGAIALALRLNTFTIPPSIVVSLVYNVQMAAVFLLGGTEAAWISVGTYLLAAFLRRPRDVSSRIFLAVVSFNVGMEALMTLAAGGVYGLIGGAVLGPGGERLPLLTPRGALAVLLVALTLKAVNETLMTVGSWLRGIPVRDYLIGARRVLPVEAGMLPLGLLLAVVGQAAGARGLFVAALALVLASVLVKRVSDTRDELQRINVNLERRIGELDVLGGVGREISSAIEIEQVLEAIHRHCSQLIDTSNIFIALISPDGAGLDIALYFEGGQRQEGRRMRRGEGLTSLVLDRREPLLIADLEREAGALPARPVQLEPMRPRSWLGVPLIASDEVLGVMTVQDERPNAYDQETVRVLTTIAAQAAISIRNAQLVRRIVDQVRLEQENSDLRLLNQRKNEFVSMVAHQLQSPLTAIIGFSDLARRQPDLKDSVSKVETIHREAARLSQLVEQLLSLSRIRSGRITPARRNVDLNAIVREVVDSQVLLIREREMEIEVALEPEGLPIVADPALVHQALANLLNNALKYSPSSSTITITTARHEGSDGECERAVLSVRDRGRGVADQERERIFEEFYRARTLETQQVKGSGLGLTIAKEIVEIHGGRISCEPAEGGGSVFSFTLPTMS